MTDGLPARGEYVLRGGLVVSMDRSIGDVADADVHVRDGVIVAVGPRRPEPAGAIVLDTSDRLVMPGFVDTHWHLWNSLLRGVIGDGARSYFPVKNRLAPWFTVEDASRSVRLALAEAATCGITTLNDWDHNVRSPEYADADAAAIVASGLRARFSYGNADKLDPSTLMDLGDVLRFGRDWTGPAGDGRLSLGMAVRGPVRTDPDITRREFAFARDHGIPMTMHCGGRREEAGRYCEIGSMSADGLLGPDLQVVHAVHATPAEIGLLADAGCHISLSPLTEFRSMGIPPVGAFLEAGLLVSLSIDTIAIPTNADMFSQMKSLLSVERARTGGPTVTARRVLEMATIDGARDLGLEAVAGSLSPGKRADLITVRLDSVHTAPAADPIAAVVAGATPADVDLVIADGRILKRDGRLTAVDERSVVRDAGDALRGIAARAGWDLQLGRPSPETSGPAA